MEVQINYRGIELLIKGHYVEPEEQVRYYSDMSGYDGCASDFDIKEMFVLDSEVDIIDLFFEDDLEKITNLVIEKIEG